MTNKKYSRIIWDWNGTLFDDVTQVVKTLNIMLAKRKMKTLSGVSEFRRIMCFPVINCYKKMGFDFNKNGETYDEVAKEYISLYHGNKTGNCKLFENAENVLKTIKNMGITQVILSASEKGNLLSQISEFNIAGYFDEILGLSDIYAKSKIETGLDYINRNNAGNVLLIGDTDHDYEVAKALNCDCFLIPDGHQSRERLDACGVPVLDDITQVLEYV